MKLETQNPKPETRNVKLGTQNSKLETRNVKLETQNLKLETQNLKLETRNLELGTWNSYMEMKKKFLAIDIGNTHITTGVFEGERLLAEFRLMSSAGKTSDEYGLLFYRFLENKDIRFDDFSGCGISSVVDELTGTIQQAIEKFTGIETKIIHSGLKLNFINKYDEPLKLGADRICAVYAAVKKHGSPVIVVDFGTAATIEVVNNEGEYLGGVIMPGIQTMSRSLHENTSKLPEIEKEFPESVIGKNTTDCIKSGVFYGSLFAFESFVRKICEELNYKPIVIATGGFAGIMAQKSILIDEVAGSLVLEGVRGIYQENFVL